MKKTPETKLTLRGPENLIAAMRLLAQQHDRSLNAEIVHALREYAERHAADWVKQYGAENDRH